MHRVRNIGAFAGISSLTITTASVCVGGRGTYLFDSLGTAASARSSRPAEGPLEVSRQTELRVRGRALLCVIIQSTQVSCRVHSDISDGPSLMLGLHRGLR